MSVFERRQKSPVRRHSHLKGTESSKFHEPYPGKDVAASAKWFRHTLEAAKAYTRKHKAKGKRHGGLGYVAIDILELFGKLADFKTGQLDPSYVYIRECLGYSIDAISRALKQLRAHGFIDWVRRFVPSTDARGKLIYVQTSNAYRVYLPPAAAKLLGRVIKPAPLPEDEQHRLKELEANRKRVLAELGYEEQSLYLFGSDDPLGNALAKLGRRIEKRNHRRDSAIRSETMT